MEVKDIITIVQTVGVPAAALAWMMWRTDKKIDEQTKSNQRVAVALAVMAEAIDLRPAEKAALKEILEGKDDKS